MNARHGLVLAALLGAACAPGALLAAPAAAAPAAPVAATAAAFIGSVYRDYFADPAAARKHYVDGGALYSASLRALMDANRAACAKTARVASKCGWNADGDPFLYSQESDPALTLASSGFAAKAAGPKAVDVRFLLFPGQPDTQRVLRLMLVRENGQWKVDDVIDAEQGRYPRKNSLRHLIAAESRYANAIALEVADAASWVGIYVDNEAADWFARFAAFPLSVCERPDACVQYRQDDPRLPALVGTLKQRYYAKGVQRPPAPARVRPAGKAPAEGSTVRNGPFDYTFQRGQWWVTRIDLARPPGRRP